MSTVVVKFRPSFANIKYFHLLGCHETLYSSNCLYIEYKNMFVMSLS